MPEAVPGAWQVFVDSCYQAPYMHNGPYWIGSDDFNGDNSDEGFPLMKTINRALASGAEYVPSHPCTGTAPFCDLGFATDAPTPPSVVEDCTENGQRLPDPTDCHIYYRCSDPD